MDRTHLITVVSEKVLLAIIGVATCIAAGQHLYSMYLSMQIVLADLFLLFIFSNSFDNCLIFATAVLNLWFTISDVIFPM